MLDITDPSFNNINWSEMTRVLDQSYTEAVQGDVSRDACPYDRKSHDPEEAARAQSWLDGWMQGTQARRFSETG